jgi:hypothetical protein
MRALGLTLFLFLASLTLAQAQTQAQAPPQTARQALLEMFIAPKPGAFEKHLPEITRKVLLHGGKASSSDVLSEFVNFSAGFTANQKHFETFDVGPILLSMEPAPGGQKAEIIVERDDLEGDVDEIELSGRFYKDGQLESLPVVPRLLFTMKQENDIWKLNEMAVTLRMPFGDTDYLEGLKKMQNNASESAAVGAIRTLNTAEISYAASFPERGFTCKVAELGGTGGNPSPDHAMLIDEALASGEKSGYIFSASGCTRPASKYQMTAIPADPESGMRAFCSDESGVVRYATDGKAATCQSAGIPLQ